MVDKFYLPATPEKTKGGWQVRKMNSVIFLEQEERVAGL
jgi:hypothetical protein